VAPSGQRFAWRPHLLEACGFGFIAAIIAIGLADVFGAYVLGPAKVGLIFALTAAIRLLAAWVRRPKP
jgi:hypothetical protein